MSLPKQLAFAILVIAASLTSVLAQTEPKDQEVRSLIIELRKQKWEGFGAVSNPLLWDFQWTEPMRRILEIGAPAQNALLENIDDASIKDQIIVLLGGVGNERAVGPIIKNMVAKKDLKATPNSDRINLVANIALTNITVADVIWHYGGGIVQIEPPEDSKERWTKWWKENESSFAVKNITRSRRYTNYPNYGIYKQQ